MVTEGKCCIDKFFMLTYTSIGYDGFRHERIAWFSSEDEMKVFLNKSKENGEQPEMDMAIEILEHRRLDNMEHYD